LRNGLLELREAAETAGTSRSTIWRALKSGRMSVTRDAARGFEIDPAELFRAFPELATYSTGEGQRLLYLQALRG
jgi:hypothetical protein